MIKFLLLFIATLIIYIALLWYIPFGTIIAVCLALITTIVISLIYKLIKAIFRIRIFKSPTEYRPQETEEERRKRTNEEVDKIINSKKEG